MKRSATAVWQGSLKHGTGTISAPGGILQSAPYSFKSRFESEAGTNPEELIASAHAGCFAMAFSGALNEAGFTADRIKVTAQVMLENVLVEGWTITGSHLVLVAKVPEIKSETFKDIAFKAKANCPVSRVLKAQITLEANLT